MKIMDLNVYYSSWINIETVLGLTWCTLCISIIFLILLESWFFNFIYYNLKEKKIVGVGIETRKTFTDFQEMIKTHSVDTCTRKIVENFKLIKYLTFSTKPYNKPSILINSQGFDNNITSNTREKIWFYYADAGS